MAVSTGTTRRAFLRAIPGVASALALPTLGFAPTNGAETGGTMLNSTLDHANPDVSPAIHSMGDAYPDFGAEILMIVTLSETGERFFRLSGGRIVHEDGRDVSVTERPEVIATFKPNAVRYREGSNSAVDAALAKLRQGQLLSEDDAVGLGLHRRIA